MPDGPGTSWPPPSVSTGPVSSRGAVPSPPSRLPRLSGRTCAVSVRTGRRSASAAWTWSITSPSSARSTAQPVLSPQPVAEVLADLQRTFAALDVRWFLFGAQAAILHGVARLSADVDVTIDLGERSTGDLVAALAAVGFELRVADVEGFAEKTRVLPFVHRRSRIPVDVVLAGPGLEEQFFAGAEERQLGGVAIPVA